MIQVRAISKSYGGVRALHGVDLEIRPGEVHAICGENGAGKSTLNRILAGAIAPDAGEILIDGQPMTLGSVSASEQAGIAIVHQESTAFLHLNASENHQIMREPVAAGGLWLDRNEMARRTEASLQDLGETFDIRRPLEELSLAQRQMVAIARAVDENCRLLILDEPTASLSSKEADALFSVVRQMRERGVAVLYVSHRLEEVFALSDRVTVLRDGSLVQTVDSALIDTSTLIQLMVGREVEFRERTSYPPQEPLLSVESICRAGAFQDVSLQVRGGEVVALVGLIGAGRSEVARALFGLDRVDSGRIDIEGTLALVPEDRQHEGLHLPFTIRDNLSIATGDTLLIDRKAEKSRAQELIQELSIKTSSDQDPASSLSGGNQQKVLLGKWLATSPQVLILDEPTRGVDVGSKDQIHRLIDQLAARGAAILVISSELGEALALADRVIVMRQGRVAGELSRAEATQEKILQLSLPQPGEVAASVRQKATWPREWLVGLLLLLTIIGVTIVNPSFLAIENLRDLLVKVAPAMIVGSMLTLVILAREIDISVGSLMGLCAAILGITTSTDRLGLPVMVGVGLCLLVGLAAGTLNGILVAYAKIPSIIVTLGMLTILRGVTELLMGGKWIENLPASLRALGTAGVLGVPYSVWVAASALAIGVWITRRTPLGLRTYALGSNPQAAALRGLPVNRIKVGVFALTGLAAAVATLVSATQLQVIESGFGSGFELVVVAAVIVGGTSIRGGRGSVIGTALGAALLGVISTALIYLRLGESATYWERAIQGAFILLAIMSEFLGRKRSNS